MRPLLAVGARNAVGIVGIVGMLSNDSRHQVSVFGARTRLAPSFLGCNSLALDIESRDDAIHECVIGSAAKVRF